MKSLLVTANVLIAVVFPLAAQTNVTGTVTLTSGQHLNLDTGTAGNTGSGDIYWSSTPQIGTLGNAMIASPPASVTASNFSSLTQAQLVGYTYDQSQVFTLTAGTVFAVHTNGGNYAAVLITAVASDSSTITLQFTTFTAPTISQVLNNYSQVGPGFPNSGIALGSLFIIKGGSMASATTVSALESSASPGLPTTLNGATVNVTVNGTTVHPAFYYAIASQLALVMPSNTPVGAGTITVTYNGQTSLPANIQVVANAFGFAGYFEYSGGLGIATNLTNGAFYYYTESLPPGTTVSLWGSGLGADAARDTTFVAPVGGFAINSLAAIYVGGVSAAIGYQGASGYPGVNQINVTIPLNVPTGCHVPVVGVNTAGVPTNFITLPIGTGVCEEPELSRDGNLLSKLAMQSKVNAGSVSLNVPLDASGNFNSPPTPTPDANAAVGMFPEFYSYTGAGFATAPGIVSSGGCIANSDVYSTAITGLAPGEVELSFDGNNFIYVPTQPSPGFIALLLPGGILFPGGSITLPFQQSTFSPVTIGAFAVTISLPSPTINWTNQSDASTITKANGLLVKWTGGLTGTYVTISGSASGTGAAGDFTCTAPQSAGQFTVPPYVFASLAGTSATITVANQNTPQTFSASGLDFAYQFGSDSQTVSAVLK